MSQNLLLEKNVFKFKTKTIAQHQQQKDIYELDNGLKSYLQKWIIKVIISLQVNSKYSPISIWYFKETDM